MYHVIKLLDLLTNWMQIVILIAMVTRAVKHEEANFYVLNRTNIIIKREYPVNWYRVCILQLSKLVCNCDSEITFIETRGGPREVQAGARVHAHLPTIF